MCVLWPLSQSICASNGQFSSEVHTQTKKKHFNHILTQQFATRHIFLACVLFTKHTYICSHAICNAFFFVCIDVARNISIYVIRLYEYVFKVLMEINAMCAVIVVDNNCLRGWHTIYGGFQYAHFCINRTQITRSRYIVGRAATRIASPDKQVHLVSNFYTLFILLYINICHGLCQL